MDLQKQTAQRGVSWSAFLFGLGAAQSLGPQCKTHAGDSIAILLVDKQIMFLQ
jgi:hypothetical protein